ncbi:hypothetical protein PFISCL1PPCAC_21318, partial [Pristionchus fissidentatus]
INVDLSGVDDIEEVDKFLIDDVVQFDFLLFLINDISKEHCREYGRIDSEQLLGINQFGPIECTRFVSETEVERIGALFHSVLVGVDVVDDDLERRIESPIALVHCIAQQHHAKALRHFQSIRVRRRHEQTPGQILGVDDIRCELVVVEQLVDFHANDEIWLRGHLTPSVARMYT